MHKHLAKIIVAIVASISAIVVAYVQFRKPSNNPQTTTFNYVGRVIDKGSEQPIRGAEVTFEFRGAPPPIVYTDSEGIYSFSVVFTGENIPARVRVEFKGYKNFDRNITLTTETTLEDIRLTKIPVSNPKSNGGNSGSGHGSDLPNEKQEPPTQEGVPKQFPPKSYETRTHLNDSTRLERLPTFKLVVQVGLGCAGAQIFVDGKFKGTPSNGPIEVTEGQHELRLEYSAARLPTGYKLEYRKEITVSGDTVIHVPCDEFHMVKIKEKDER